MFTGLLTYYKTAILEKFVFRQNLLIQIATGFLSSYAGVAIWYVITQYNIENLGVLVVDQTIKYMILSTILSYSFYTPNYYEIFNRVETGNIVHDLVKPIPLPFCLFSKELGAVTFNFFTHGISTLIVLSFMFKIYWSTSFLNLLLFFVFVFLGFYINHAVTLCFDMLSFWVYETEALHYVRTAVLSLLSGSLVPLWFYPEIFIKIIDFLPFKGIVYIPIAMFLGIIPHTEAVKHLVLQLIWCLVLTLITYIIWHFGTKKIVINGG